MGKYNIEDFEGGFREIAEVIGLDAAMELSRAMGGLMLYIPKIDKIERIQRNQRIAQEFNGSNHAELAQTYNLSDRQIRFILDTMSRPQITIEDFIPEDE